MAQSRIESPRNLAKRLFDKNKRNKEKTVAELIGLAADRKSLRDYLLRLGATGLVGDVVGSDRREVLGRLPVEYERDVAPTKGVVPPTRSFAQAEARRAVRAGIVLTALLDFPLPTPGNKLLREANADEVFEASAWYRGSATNALRHASWLSTVAAKMPKGKVVEDVFDNRALNAIYRNTGEFVARPQKRGATENRPELH